jgi:succinyl-diaminopimelate desuccinylase
VQGHVAYPHLANNPVRGIVPLLAALLNQPLDAGSERFPASNLEVTSVDVGNAATNVIPARATAAFNVRFNDLWSVETLQAEIHNRLDAAAEGTEREIDYDLAWTERPSESFLTRDDRLIGMLSASVQAVTNRRPELSTTGGTSDARFIKNYCPVVEFGLVGKTMHMVDERVPLADLETLTQIYGDFLERWLR